MSMNNLHPAMGPKSWSDLMVGDVMSRVLVKVPLQAELRHARREMNLANVRHVAVIDPHDELAGIISDRDILRALADHGRNSLPVESFMTRRVCATSEDTSLLEAVNLMIERKFGALPVEGPEGRLIGIITETDMLIVLQAVLAGRAPSAFIAGL